MICPECRLLGGRHDMFCSRPAPIETPPPRAERDYFNTTSVDGHELRQRRSGARRQQDDVLEFFRRSPGVEFAPHEVHEVVMPDAPLTSTRRAMTNLEQAGYLIKTTTRRLGPYGADSFCWMLRREDGGVTTHDDI